MVAGTLAALLFVVLSTAARVIDYSIMRVPHQSPLMLTYDILQSAAFYGCVACSRWHCGASATIC
jgi:hypothetical protein